MAEILKGFGPEMPRRDGGLLGRRTDGGVDDHESCRDGFGIDFGVDGFGNNVTLFIMSSHLRLSLVLFLIKVSTP